MYKNIQTNNTSLTKSPTKKEKSQLNHLFCSLYGFIKLTLWLYKVRGDELRAKDLPNKYKMKLMLRA